MTDRIYSKLQQVNPGYGTPQYRNTAPTQREIELRDQIKRMQERAYYDTPEEGAQRRESISSQFGPSTGRYWMDALQGAGDAKDVDYSSYNQDINGQAPKLNLAEALKYASQLRGNADGSISDAQRHLLSTMTPKLAATPSGFLAQTAHQYGNVLSAGLGHANKQQKAYADEYEKNWKLEQQMKREMIKEEMAQLKEDRKMRLEEEKAARREQLEMRKMQQQYQMHQEKMALKNAEKMQAANAPDPFLEQLNKEKIKREFKDAHKVLDNDGMFSSLKNSALGLVGMDPRDAAEQKLNDIKATLSNPDRGSYTDALENLRPKKNTTSKTDLVPEFKRVNYISDTPQSDEGSFWDKIKGTGKKFIQGLGSTHEALINDRVSDKVGFNPYRDIEKDERGKTRAVPYVNSHGALTNPEAFGLKDKEKANSFFGKTAQNTAEILGGSIPMIPFGGLAPKSALGFAATQEGVDRLVDDANPYKDTIKAAAPFVSPLGGALAGGARKLGRKTLLRDNAEEIEALRTAAGLPTSIVDIANPTLRGYAGSLSELLGSSKKMKKHIKQDRTMVENALNEFKLDPRTVSVESAGKLGADIFRDLEKSVFDKASKTKEKQVFAKLDKIGEGLSKEIIQDNLAMGTELSKADIKKIMNVGVPVHGNNTLELLQKLQNNPERNSKSIKEVAEIWAKMNNREYGVKHALDDIQDYGKLGFNNLDKKGAQDARKVWSALKDDVKEAITLNAGATEGNKIIKSLEDSNLLLTEHFKGRNLVSKLLAKSKTMSSEDFDRHFGELVKKDMSRGSGTLLKALLKSKDPRVAEMVNQYSYLIGKGGNRDLSLATFNTNTKKDSKDDVRDAIESFYTPKERTARSAAKQIAELLPEYMKNPSGSATTLENIRLMDKVPTKVVKDAWKAVALGSGVGAVDPSALFGLGATPYTWASAGLLTNPKYLKKLKKPVNKRALLNAMQNQYLQAITQD